METIYKKECELTEYLVAQLQQFSEVHVYADTFKAQRIGAVSFNVKGLPHALLSAILNDYFGIAVRNDCFCAHPFVRECLVDELWEVENEADLPLYQGMVRASIGLYSSKQDIDTLSTALQHILLDRECYTEQYQRTADDHFVHKTFKIKTQEYFDITKTLQASFTPYFSLSQISNKKEMIV